MNYITVDDNKIRIIDSTEITKLTKKLLNTPCVRAVKGNDDKIKRIAVASGSCAEYIPLAAKLGADAIITADMKYHDSLDASESGMNVIDAGHYPTEFIITDILEKLLQNKNVETVKSYNKDVFLYITKSPGCKSFFATSVPIFACDVEDLDNVYPKFLYT